MGCSKEAWTQLCVLEGVGQRLVWNVQYGFDSEVKAVRLAGLSVRADGDGMWVEWRELLDAYFECESGAVEGG